MKNLLLALLLLLPGWGWFTHIHDQNEGVAKGTTAYRRGDAPGAAQGFTEALGSQSVKKADARLVLNLAHAQLRAGEPEAANESYGQLLTPATPALVSSVARQQLALLAAEAGETAQALSLLRQALRLDPTNASARYDYETLAAYLAKHPNQPKIPMPTPEQRKQPQQSSANSDSAQSPRPAQRKGTDQQGEVDTQKPADTSPSGAGRQPDAGGQPDAQRPDAASGSGASGRLNPGTGPAKNLPSGQQPGATRGLGNDENDNGPAPANRPGAASNEAARATDAQLQTQRERLKAMNLTPAQARQVLEALRAQEQQYLQQQPRPKQPAPDPRKPTW